MDYFVNTVFHALQIEQPPEDREEPPEDREQPQENRPSTTRVTRDVDKLELTMKSYIIESSVVERFSTVNIQSRLQNEHPYTVNSMLLVKVPEEAFISNFSIVIDGSKYVGKIVANDIKETTDNRTGTQLKVKVKYSETNKERGINIFEVDISLKRGAETTIALTYNELLVRRLGLFTQKIVVCPGQVVDTLDVSASVLENQGFEKFSYSVPNSVSISNQKVNSVRIQATRLQQSTVSSKGINGQLVIEYDLKHKKDAGNVVVEGDYFVHSCSPSGLKPMDKNILFVLDDSGSMDGIAVEQVRSSMLTILDNLNSNDYFNILTFSTSVQTWLSTPTLASSGNIVKAKSFVNDNLTADGYSTNINDSILKAIQSLKSSSVYVKRAQIIFFLTDGTPNAGERDTKIIRKNVREENNGFAAIYCLGFGDDLDFNFLRNLAYENNGFSRRIYEDEDASEQLVDIYNEIKDPLLLDVEVNYDSKYVDSTTNNKFPQYFDGTEMLVTGKLKKSGVLPSETVEVQGISKDGDLDLQMPPESVTILPAEENSRNKKKRDIQKIQQLIEIYSTNNIEQAKLDAIRLAIENNFVTKFTSFVF